MKHKIVHTVLALLLLIAPAMAQNAADIVSKAASVYNSSNGVSASFSLRTASEVQHTSESFEGIINMKGDKFTLRTPDVLTWYDGTTQWTYMEQTEEVNISTPEGDELQFTNPSILLNSYQKGFTAAYKGEATAINGKAAYVVELTPKKKSDIVKVELQIEKFSSLPVRINVLMKNGISNTIQISNIKTGINQPDSYFSFRKADYPQAEIIDLR
ncbi:membrane protein [Bacteroidia bacterium]|nr:membrane protein [Bacteroidia bacterium]